MDEQPQPSLWNKLSSRCSYRTRLVLILCAVLVVTGAGVLLLCLTAGSKATDTPGLKLIDTVVRLPLASYQTLDLLLPCTGTLSLEIAVAGEEDRINVFVVAPDQVAKMLAKKTFSHLPGFDGNQTAKYRRSARLAAGKYCLVLMAPGPLASSTANLHVRARLVDLK